jgi:TM2 domain-containing membrane protein YozV
LLSIDRADYPATMNPLPQWERFRLLRAESEFEAVRKDPRIAYGLWCVTGIFGGHRFYLGDTALSVAMLFTLGGLGVWSLLDVFFIGRRVRAVNRTRRAAIMARHGLIDAQDGVPLACSSIE